MTQVLTIDTGSGAYVAGVAPLDDETFGVRYLSYHSLDRFAEQIAELDAGLIVWPGGTLAEQRTDRYGFEHEDFYDSTTGKPGLTEMLAFASDMDCAFSMVIPTARYADDLDTLRAEVSGFVEALVAGEYGPLPDRLILEVGNEYYANLPDDAPGAAAQLYGTMADMVISEIAAVLAASPDQATAGRIEIAVQSGKTLADDEIIRDTLSDAALENVDLVVHHHFPWAADGVDARVARVDAILDNWARDAEEIGAEPPDLFMSSWNVATLTRAGALQTFLEMDKTGLTAGDVDLDGRSTTGFETFWQNELGKLDYGSDHAGLVLEMFASYARIGMAAGAIYGSDSVQPGRLSLRDDTGEDHDFVGQEMYEMLSESVRGCTPLDEDEDVAPGLRVYGFENDDKLVVFLAANGRAPEPVTLDLHGVGSDYISVSADALHGEIDPDWMSRYGVPDNTGVDETPEAWTYATPVLRGIGTAMADGNVTVAFTEADQVIRIAFAKTAAGEADIASWSEGSFNMLSAEQAEFPTASAPELAEEDFIEDGGWDGGGMEILLLLPGVLFAL